MTRLIKSIIDIKSELAKIKRPVGFVPTMGALHDGHISLIKAAREECKTVVVSIFVNPLQFGPNEDFKEYPRTLEKDLKVCEECNVDFVFSPETEEIYPELKNEVMVSLPDELAGILCGKIREGHFQGVATVVKKLFNVIEPDYAYFGEKDLQQLYIIRWLVKNFNLQVFVRACPIVREKNGMACSSRNKYLTKEQKEIAANLYRALKTAKYNIRTGIFTVSKAILEGLIFLSQFPEIKVEYFEARDKENFKKTADNKKNGFYFLVAAKIGKVRLIDNLEI